MLDETPVDRVVTVKSSISLSDDQDACARSDPWWRPNVSLQ
jgi:hypothetical protein